jgi:hypothetical protein
LTATKHATDGGKFQRLSVGGAEINPISAFHDCTPERTPPLFCSKYPKHDGIATGSSQVWVFEAIEAVTHSREAGSQTLPPGCGRKQTLGFVPLLRNMLSQYEGVVQFDEWRRMPDICSGCLQARSSRL